MALAKSLFVNSFPTDLLRSDTPIERVKTLFKTYVAVVEIENHSYCNRTCWFCPNVFLDRRSANHIMPDEVYQKIIGDLASIQYEKLVIWSGYNEPLAHASIYDRVAQVRAALPNAYFVIISNGDYLNRNTFKQLEAADLDNLTINLYLPDGKEEDEGELAAALQHFRSRTGLSLIKCGPRDYVVRGSRIKTTVKAPLFSHESMHNRGGLLDIPKTHAYRRRAVCLEPVRHVVIDHDGKGVLCCHTRSDAPQHESAIIGDLSLPDYSLFHYYRDLGPARMALVSPGLKGGVCQSCDARDSGPDRLARNHSVASAMEMLGIGRLLGKFLLRRDRSIFRRAAQPDRGGE